MTQSIGYEYAFANGSAGTSKWDDRRGVLMFALKDGSHALPSDARLLVSIGDSHVTYPLTGGTCIVPLPSAGSGNVVIKLVSDMFPNATEPFTFTVSLFSSNTKAGCADSATTLSSCEISFSIAQKLTLSLHAELKENSQLPHYPDESGGMPSIQFKVEGIDNLPGEYTAQVSLHNKTKDGYVYTMYTKELRELTSENGCYVLPLPDLQINAETPHLSLMLKVEILDSNNATVHSVPLYFILINNYYNYKPPAESS